MHIYCFEACHLDLYCSELTFFFLGGGGGRGDYLNTPPTRQIFRFVATAQQNQILIGWTNSTNDSGPLT